MKYSKRGLLPTLITLAIIAIQFLPIIARTEALKLELKVEKFKLENGLTVLLHEDHSVPLVSYHTWYRVGSRDEKNGVTGAAHMLEHMMFKGAKKYSGKDFDRILHENGITNNAFTTNDYTGFYQNLPSSKLELMMDMEVDRMRFLTLSPQDLKSELQVVGEERRWRVDNNPSGLLRELMMSSVYKMHPYTWPVIGHMADIQAYTSEKLKYFYDTFYLPNNAVLVIAGDIDVDRTKRLIEKYYGDLESKNLPDRKYTVEPLKQKPTRKELKWEVESESVLVGYKGVEAGHKDSFALDIASSVLGSGTSSRLYKKLVYDKQMATSVSSYNMTLADPGVFMAMASMKPGMSSSEAENGIATEVQRLKDQLVSEKELVRAKNQIMRDFVDSLTTIDGKAQTLAINEILFNDYRRFFSDLESYQKVTREEVQQVTKKYLVETQKVVTVLVPKKAGAKQ